MRPDAASAAVESNVIAKDLNIICFDLIYSLSNLFQYQVQNLFLNVDSVCLSLFLDFLHAENVRTLGRGNQNEYKGDQDDSEQNSEGDSRGRAGFDSGRVLSRQVKLSVVKWLHLTIRALAISVVIVTRPQAPELLQLGRGDWLNFREHSPLDALRTGWRSEGAVVAVEFIHIYGVQKSFQVYLRSRGLCGTAAKDLGNLVDEQVFTRATALNVEHEAEHGSVVTVSIRVRQMNNVHLKIVGSAINSVL